MPQFVLTPQTFAEGDTIEVVLRGKPASIFWKDEDTLVIDGDERPILVTDFDSDSIGFAYVGRGEDTAPLRRADPKKVVNGGVIFPSLGEVIFLRCAGVPIRRSQGAQVSALAVGHVVATAG